MTELILFASQYITVLLLVTQSISNNHGRRATAALTSVGIGVCQIATFKLLPGAGLSEAAALIAAGPLANLTAQWLMRHDIAKIRALPAASSRDAREV